MPTPITLKIDGHDISAELNDSSMARAVADALPLTATARRWGDEYYFSTSVSADGSDPLDDVFEVGEIGFWPPGSAFCLFFGPTPVSRGGEPRMANPGHSIGKLLDGVDTLKSLGGSVSVEVRLETP